MRKYFGFTLVMCFLANTLTFAQQDCELKKSANDIKVYLCDNETQKFKTIIVELEMPATLSQYAALVLDINNSNKWQYKVAKQEVLKTISATELYYYSEVSPPWPVSNRDVIFHMILRQDSASRRLTVTLEAMPKYLPENDGVVRLPYAESTLTVDPIDKGHVKVRYELDVDPGGDVPAWVINLFAPNAPWHTYNNFRELIKEQGTNRVEVPYIKNFKE